VPPAKKLVAVVVTMALPMGPIAARASETLPAAHVATTMENFITGIAAEVFGVPGAGTVGILANLFRVKLGADIKSRFRFSHRRCSDE